MDKFVENLLNEFRIDVKLYEQLERESRDSRKQFVRYGKDGEIVYLDLGYLLSELEWRLHDDPKLSERIVAYFDENVLDLSSLPEIQTFLMSRYPITDLILSDNEKLEILSIKDSKIEKFQLEDTTIKEFDCSFIDTQDYSKRGSVRKIILPKTLEKFSCSKNKIDEINIDHCEKLKYLHCSWNDLKELQLPRSDKLESLYCSDNLLNDLDTSSFANLENLSVSGNPISKLDVSQNERLETLFCASCGLNALDVSSNKLLRYLDCKQNNISLLDISKNRRLRNLSCKGNPLKKLEIYENSSLQNLSVDEDVEVKFYPIQAIWIPFLRKEVKLPEDVLNTCKLHDRARSYNWDDGTKALFRIIRSKKCDRATAHLIYWLANPLELYQIEKDDKLTEYQEDTIKLIKEIEEKVEEGGFERNLFSFDPNDWEGLVLMDEQSEESDLIPEYMKKDLEGINDLEEIR